MHKRRGVFTGGWSNLATWRKRSWILAFSAVLAATSTYGEDVIWIGQPTARDYMALNMRRALEQYSELRQQMAQFEAQIEEARRAYFAASPSDRAAAGDKFGEMLFQKDLLIAWPRVASDGDSAKLMAGIIALANDGRPPDGGIPPSAREAFNNWVIVLRFSVGGAVGMTLDPIKAGDALQNSASLKEYEEYRRLRDQAEWDEWESQRNGGMRKLLANHVLSPRTYFGENVMKAGFDYQVAQLNNHILQCEYAGRQVDGSIFHFWEGQPPENIAFLIAMNQSAFIGLVDHAVDQCPPDSKQASDIESSPIKVTITPKMAKEASIKSRSAPPLRDPVPVIEEQNARARQQINERLAVQKDRDAKFRACSEELQTDITAARQAKDRNSLKEAHVKYRECTLALRRPR